MVVMAMVAMAERPEGAAGVETVPSQPEDEGAQRNHAMLCQDGVGCVRLNLPVRGPTIQCQPGAYPADGMYHRRTGEVEHAPVDSASAQIQ